MTFAISKPSYESISVILQSTEKHTNLLDLALRELKAFQAKYSTLSQLEPVFEAINTVSGR